MFSDIIKNEPGVSDVHVPAAIGDDPKKKRKKVSAFISDTKPHTSAVADMGVPVTNSVNKAGFVGAGGSSGQKKRKDIQTPWKEGRNKNVNKAQSFLKIMEKKASHLVGLSAAVNLAHSSGARPKKIKYGSKTYRLDSLPSDPDQIFPTYLRRVSLGKQEPADVEKTQALIRIMKKLGYDL